MEYNIPLSPLKQVLVYKINAYIHDPQRDRYDVKQSK